MAADKGVLETMVNNPVTETGTGLLGDAVDNLGDAKQDLKDGRPVQSLAGVANAVIDGAVGVGATVGGSVGGAALAVPVAIGSGAVDLAAGAAKVAGKAGVGVGNAAGDLGTKLTSLDKGDAITDNPVTNFAGDAVKDAGKSLTQARKDLEKGKPVHALVETLNAAVDGVVAVPAGAVGVVGGAAVAGTAAAADGVYALGDAGSKLYDAMFGESKQDKPASVAPIPVSVAAPATTYGLDGIPASGATKTQTKMLDGAELKELLNKAGYSGGLREAIKKSGVEGTEGFGSREGDKIKGVSEGDLFLLSANVVADLKQRAGTGQAK